MRPRVRDIAQAAGVSPATVSNVLNKKKGVSVEIAKNVLKIAQGMGYKSESPESIPAQRTIRFVMYKKHGLVIMDTPFFAELIAGIEQTFREQGYDVLITGVNRTDPNREDRIRAITDDADTPFILLGTEMSEDDIEPFTHAKAPMLVLDRNASDQLLYSVTLDNFGAGLSAARIFLANGHRRMGYLSSSQPFQNCTYRRYGFECALRDEGLSIAPEDLLLLEPTMEGSYRDMLAHLKQRKTSLPTAFFSMNDIIAIGASRALKECGYVLPRDMSMIGVDDIPAASIVSPALTTMSVSKADYGHAAAVHLLYAVRKNPLGVIRPTSVVTQIVPVERKSVTTPRQTDGKDD